MKIFHFKISYYTIAANIRTVMLLGVFVLYGGLHFNRLGM